MIYKILTLKQHKTHQAATLMHKDELVLESETRSLQEINSNIERLIATQQEESDRLFEELSKAPATMLELETYNTTLAKMKQTLNMLYMEKKAIETRQEEARKKLLTSQDALKIATQKQEKFSYLNQNIRDMARIESEYKEDQLLDEIIDTMFSSPSKTPTTQGVF